MFCPPQPLRLVWITPACAGKSLSVPTHGSRPGDHPRVCGEKGFIGLEVGLYPGSPPRVRGKEQENNQQYTFKGITPACAGKSHMRSSGIGWHRDHPRVCGEKRRTEPFLVSMEGSPPRMRGKVKACRLLTLAVRITPACAGKSKSLPSPHTSSKDHPRMCGEKKPAPSGLDSQQGSPPRMRGKGRTRPRSFAASGITPAYAGKSKTASSG